MKIYTLLYDKFGNSKLRDISNSKLFWSGLFIKLILAAICTSVFFKDYFIPFVDYYVDSGFQNPYKHFWDLGLNQAFPYPALMLYIMAIPRILFAPFSGNDVTSFQSLLLHRLPLFLADGIILVVLVRWLKTSTKKILRLYWLSPVLIYISYIHGQLDVIPIAFLFVSLYLLFKDQYKVAFLVLGLALATKTHIAITVPFFLIYLLYRGLKFRVFSSCIVLCFLGFILPNIFYIADPAFLHMVFYNAQQFKTLDTVVAYGKSLFFYVIPAAYLLLLFKAIVLKVSSRDLFIMFLGFSFGILIFFIPPMPGWYFWTLPFFAYFYAKNKQFKVLLFGGLSLLYLIYFASIPGSDYLISFSTHFTNLITVPSFYQLLTAHSLHPDVYISLTFTCLQTVLLLNCFWIYWRGVSDFSKHKLLCQPYLIGIGGNSGVGKTTLSQLIEQVFESRNTTVIHGDDMHKWERGHTKWQEFTHLNPKANDLQNEYLFLSDLKHGRKIKRRHYDHISGVFKKAEKIRSNKLIIFEGLLPFYLKRIRELYDFKVFIKLEPEIGAHWKIIRDRNKRNYSKEQILEQIRKRTDDSEKFIVAQEKHADLLIEFCSKNKLVNIGDENEIINYFLKLKFSNNIYLDPIINELEKIETLKIIHDYERDDCQFIEIDGLIKNTEVEFIAFKSIRGLQEIGINNSHWEENLIGMLQLFIAYYINENTTIHGKFRSQSS